MSHTQGKLRVSAYGIFTESDPRKIVAVMNRSDLEQEDARRLVACWNALEDLPQDALDGGWTRAGLEAYGIRMKAQRDELLAALKAMVEVHGVRWEHVRGDNTIPSSWVELTDTARAAIAKAVQS